MELCAITDEISENLDEALDLLSANHVTAVELRTITGFNVVDITDAELGRVRDQLQRRRMRCVVLASPLFKWGTTTGIVEHDSFGFLAPTGHAERVAKIERAMSICQYLEIPNIRIFSGFDDGGRDTMRYAISAARLAGVRLLVENEPSCTARDVQSLSTFLHGFDGEVEALLDIGNAYLYGRVDVTSEPDRALLPFVRHIHVKDRRDSRWVPLGTGEINYPRIFDDIRRSGHAPEYVSLEPHVKGNRRRVMVDAIRLLRTMLHPNGRRTMIIGCGRSGTHVAKTVSRLVGFTITAVCDTDPDRAVDLARTIDARAYTRLETALASEQPAAAMVCTPPATHASTVERLLSANIDCVVEKPSSTTRAELDRLATHRSSNRISVLLQHRFNPMARAAVRNVMQGKIGNVITAAAGVRTHRGSEYYAEPWRASYDGGGDVLNAQGAHVVDLLLLALGPLSHATGFRVFGSGGVVETSACVALRFTSGTLATLELTTSAHSNVSSFISFTGDRGSISISGANLDRVWASTVPVSDAHAVTARVAFFRAFRRRLKGVDQPLYPSLENAEKLAESLALIRGALQ